MDRQAGACNAGPVGCVSVPTVEDHRLSSDRQTSEVADHSESSASTPWRVQAYGLVGITFLTFFPKSFHVQEDLFFLLLAGMGYLAWKEKFTPWVRTPIDMPLLGFAGWVLCTVPFAFDPAYSFSEWRKLAAQVLLFYWARLVLHRYRRLEHLHLIVYAFAIGSLILSGYAVADFLLRGGTWKDRFVRAGAPFSDYNWLTTYLVLTIPILIGWLVIIRAQGTRLLGTAALIAAGVAQVAAYTRAGWVAHVVQALSFALMTGRRRLIVWILVGALVMGYGVLVVSKAGYQQDTLDPWTLSARVKTWQLGLYEVFEHPVSGVGYGYETFARIHAAEIEGDRAKGAEEKILQGLHNTFAMVVTGSGIPALFFLLWIFVRTVQQLAREVPLVRSSQEGMQLLAPAVAIAVIGFGVRNFFDYMFAGSVVSLFWILVAVGFAIKAERDGC
jgi:heptosyltransferase-3/putative inorganic carbon (HCO3(-)) transporter